MKHLYIELAETAGFPIETSKEPVLDEWIRLFGHISSLREYRQHALLSTDACWQVDCWVAADLNFYYSNQQAVVPISDLERRAATRRYFEALAWQHSHDPQRWRQMKLIAERL